MRYTRGITVDVNIDSRIRRVIAMIFPPIRTERMARETEREREREREATAFARNLFDGGVIAAGIRAVFKRGTSPR